MSVSGATIFYLFFFLIFNSRKNLYTERYVMVSVSYEWG